MIKNEDIICTEIMLAHHLSGLKCYTHLHGRERLDEQLRQRVANRERHQKEQGKHRIDGGGLENHRRKRDVLRTVRVRGQGLINAPAMQHKPRYDEQGGEDVHPQRHRVVRGRPVDA